MKIVSINKREKKEAFTPLSPDSIVFGNGTLFIIDGNGDCTRELTDLVLTQVGSSNEHVLNGLNNLGWFYVSKIKVS